jgi:hypothetical protein
VAAISTRPPNAHNRCSAISDQNFPLATRTPINAALGMIDKHPYNA